MKHKYSGLLTPVKINQTIFRNRIFSAPITPFFYTDDHARPSDALIEHYVTKAKGGCGCIIMSGVSIDPIVHELDDPVGDFEMFRYADQRALIKLINRVHSYGCGMGVELNHFCYGYTVSGDLVGGAAFVHAHESNGEMPEEIMKKIADDLARGAAQAKQLGFDIVMLHMGHGGTLSQFLSPLWNKRTDEYGGSLENRARFPLMILKAVREAVGKYFPIEIRISGDDKREGSITIDQSIEFVRLAQQYVDSVNISTGSLARDDSELLLPSTQMPSDYMPVCPNLGYAEAVRKAEGITCNIATVGGYQDLDDAEAIIDEGKADVVYIARGLIADPELANHAYKEEPEKVNPCIKCYHCVDTLTRFSCSVNPIIGLEQYANLEKPISEKKRVAVIGGGPAGLKAAATAAGRGHDVTLYEKSDRLGGRLAFADKMPFKRGIKKLKNYLILDAESKGVKFVMNTVVTRELLEKENYDHVIVAIGADCRNLKLPGLDHAINMEDLYEKDAEVGKNVVIIGGGLSGTETAIYLARKGHKVSLVEATGDLCGGMHFGSSSLEYYRVAVGNVKAEENVSIYLNALCQRAENGKVIIKQDGKEIGLDYDTVILSVGLNARVEESLDLWLPGSRTDRAGDCIKAADIETAIRTAYYAAENIGA